MDVDARGNPQITEIYNVPTPTPAVCASCGNPFLPPVLPSSRSGSATLCRDCMTTARGAEKQAEQDAFTLTVTAGTIAR